MPPPITPAAKHDDVAQRYGLDLVPENIAHLTRLVARQDADLEEIGSLIAKDSAITARLLRFANPQSESEKDYDITTVEEALMRTGLGPVILLAMLGPLTRAVLNAFEMFLTPLKPSVLETLQPLVGEHVLATVRFSGKGTGLVQLRLAPTEAQSIACAAIGVATTNLTSPEEIDDVIGELANIVGGNLESNLCDAGIACKLTAPLVNRVTSFQKLTTSGGVSERLGFSSSAVTAFVDVSVNPWNE
jgi:CheY-specific phosphatase CheX